MSERSLEQLLRAMRRGDEPAARLFHARLAGVLTAHARAILRDGALAEDAAQRAFLRALRARRAEVRRIRDAQAWMAAVVRREALMLLRAERRRIARERAHAPHPASPGADGLDALHDAIDRLPARLREAVTLRHACGLTYDQMGLALGISPNTAASRHRLAMTRLRDALDPETITHTAPRTAPEARRVGTA